MTRETFPVLSKIQVAVYAPDPLDACKLSKISLPL